ncbi:hypothetical protein KKB18_11955 [bacterium]|nr:hypothetical protein [bacterium]
MLNKKAIFYGIITSYFILSFYSISLSQNENDTCLGCHNDSTLVRERKGMEGTSVYVDEKKYKSSVHQEILCINCHFDADVQDFPHSDTMNPVDCSLCHVEINNKFHFSTDKVYQKLHISENLQKLNKCVFCHGKHDILPKSD